MAEKFFLGSFSPDGFRGSFSDLFLSPAYKTVILKGGAGTGKSTLMKRLSDRFGDRFEVTSFHCSSDPDSLDAIVIHGLDRIVVDGTAPHLFDPIYPGVRQKILDLGEFWDESTLCRKEAEIVSITNEHKKLTERTKRYVQALSSVFSDTFAVASDSLLSEKLSGFSSRLSKKLLPKGGTGTGAVALRQLSALTPKGYLTFSETLDGWDIYLLKDPFFAASDTLLRELSESFTAKGQNVSISLCNVFSQPVYEHLLVPVLKTAFVTSDPLTRLEMPSAKPVNMLRFYNKQTLSGKKYRLRLNRNACADLTQEASDTMRVSLKTHDLLEQIYISAMNFSALDRAFERLAQQFERS